MKELWKITYKDNETNEDKEICYYDNKQLAIIGYCNALSNNSHNLINPIQSHKNICSLKIWKNDEDYTIKLNGFLHGRRYEA